MDEIRLINEELSRLAKIMDKDSGAGYRQYKSDVGRDAAKKYDDLMDARDGIRAAPGNLYKHDLPDEDIARYLDWDAPLSEQGDIGQRAMDALKVAEKPSAALSAADKDLLDQLAVDLADFDVSGPHPYEGMTGAQLYNQMQNTFGSSSVFSKNNAAQQAASEALAQAGIPGLHDYDGMSRNQSTMKDIFVNGKKATFAEESVIRNKDNFGGWEGIEKTLRDGQADKMGLTKDAGDEILKNLDALKAAEVEMKAPIRTRNFVTWDQDVLNRMKLLERNGEIMGVLPTPKK
jgi:hypothetical protein